MADTNASSEFLPPITRDRGDSIMSLGPGINLHDNGGAPANNGAGALASPTAPPDPAPPATRPQAAYNAGDEKLVQDVLTSEVTNL